jgi:CarD family transcriptional regulator
MKSKQNKVTSVRKPTATKLGGKPKASGNKAASAVRTAPSAPAKAASRITAPKKVPVAAAKARPKTAAPAKKPLVSRGRPAVSTKSSSPPRAATAPASRPVAPASSRSAASSKDSTRGRVSNATSVSPPPSARDAEAPPQPATVRAARAPDPLSVPVLQVSAAIATGAFPPAPEIRPSIAREVSPRFLAPAASHSSSGGPSRPAFPGSNRPGKPSFFPINPNAMRTHAASVSVSGKVEPVEFVEGDHVVYPTHGVGKVTGIVNEEIAGHKLQLIVVTFDENRMTLRVPVAKARSSGLRKLASRKMIETALSTLKGRARIKRTMWSRRAQEYEAKINSGDPVAIAEVVRDLHRNAGQPDQSFSERQIYEAALDRLASEIAAIDGTDKGAASEKLAGVLKAA